MRAVDKICSGLYNEGDEDAGRRPHGRPDSNGQDTHRR